MRKSAFASSRRWRNSWLSDNDATIVAPEIYPAAISRHVAVEPDNVQVKMGRDAAVSTLEIEVRIPNMAEVSQLAVNS